MNLADIRKKAQGKGDATPVETPPPPLPVEPTPEPPAETVTDDREEYLQDTSSFAADMDDIFAEPETFVPPVFTTERAAHHFDPLALLLAGRESASVDEEVSSSAVDARMSETSEFQEFLCFRVAAESYAVNIMEIKEIIKPRDVTEVPRVPPFVSGILSLRGIIIPVYTMRLRLGFPAVEQTGKSRIIVVKKGEEFCGLLVDEVVQVVRLETKGIELPPAILDGIDREFVNGLGRHEGKMLILLNMEKILDIALN
jgi:purine-binding chemotaxis protein CheW